VVLMRVHLGNGSIYLTPTSTEDGKAGWLNVDLQSPRQHLAADRPDLAKTLAATDEDYYRAKRNVTFDQNAVYDPEGVSDVYGDFLRIPVAAGSASEILARQVIEHLSIHDAQLALCECARALEPGGILRIDVPDVEETLKRFRETGEDFLKRHILGSRKNSFAYHLAGWTREGLTAMAERAGFDFVTEEPNIHLYPAIAMRFRKMGAGRPAWDYAMEDHEIPPSWKCADFGCGAHPWPRANVIADFYREHAKGARPNQQFVTCDVCAEMPFKADYFDFAMCSHVLEHVSRPDLAAAEISRVARRGVIICPSLAKEALTGWCDLGHEWECLRPAKASDPLRFRRIDKDWRGKVRHDEMTAAMWRMMIAGYSGGEDGATLRRWFAEREALLDIVYFWERPLRVEIVE
jgi:predicted SAM-dependent methyltransferase